MKNKKIFGLAIMIIFLLSSIAYAGPEEICNFQGTVSKADGTKLDGSTVTAHDSEGNLLETAVSGYVFGDYSINVFKKDLPVNFMVGGIAANQGEVVSCGENPNELDLTIGTVESVDYDGDGYYSSESGGNDCNDNSSSIHPGATEVCGDGVDQDCSGSDLACSSTEGSGGGAGGGGGGGGGSGGSYVCTPEWHCTPWSECQPDGYMTRSCTDKNSCNNVQYKPAEEEECTYNSGGEGEGEQQEEQGGVDENLPPAEGLSEGEAEPDVEPEGILGLSGATVLNTLGTASNMVWLVLLGLLFIVLMAIILSMRKDDKPLVKIK